MGGIVYMGWCAASFLGRVNSTGGWIFIPAYLLPMLGWYIYWWLIPLIAYSALVGLALLCFCVTRLEYTDC